MIIINFSKPFTTQYFVGGCVVLVGIYLNVMSKNQVSGLCSRKPKRTLTNV